MDHPGTSQIIVRDAIAIRIVCDVCNVNIMMTSVLPIMQSKVETLNSKLAAMGTVVKQMNAA